MALLLFLIKNRFRISDHLSQKMKCFCFTLCFLLACLFISISISSRTIFYDSIDDIFAGRWITSQKPDNQALWNAESEECDHYARKYAIVRELDEAVTIRDGTVVLQFQTVLQNGSECGAVYLKYLSTQDEGWRPEEFSTHSRYSIMFGPDICGSINKLNFIITHKNIEHHLKSPPSIPSDQRIQVYTAILKPDYELRILVNGKEKRKASFLSAEDFEPPLDPANTFPENCDEEEEDGEFEASKIKCETWKSKRYQTLDKPNFEPIVAIGIEIWTRRYGILVDNILIASDEMVAESFWEAPWKFEAKRERRKKIVFDLANNIAEIPFFSKYKNQILDHIQKLEKQPEPRIRDYIVLAILAISITILFLWKQKENAEVSDNIHFVPFSGNVIETVVAKSAQEADAWISNIRSSRYKGQHIVVGLDCEWKPNTVKFAVPNRAAILQLCVETKCLIIQLFYMDVPQSVRRFLRDPNFIFVGVEVKRDIKKLSEEYGIRCSRFDDLRNLALRSGTYSFCKKYGLRNLGKYVVGLQISKPEDACRSNWEARELDEDQIQYASIDAYASYRIGHKLINEM